VRFEEVKGVAEKQRHRHRPNAPRHRGDVRCLGAGRFVLHISDNPSLAAGGQACFMRAGEIGENGD